MLVNRRKLLLTGVAASIMSPLSAVVMGEEATLPPTPACGNNADLTAAQTAGPFYLARSPERRDLREGDTGDTFLLQGWVVNQQCQPLENVVVDLWHANAQGQYDRRGYRYRGYQRSHSRGGFSFLTIHPGLYPGRTPHFHVRLWQNQQLLLTTQLYFPGIAQNQRDGLFDPALLMSVNTMPGGDKGQFLFVLNKGV